MAKIGTHKTSKKLMFAWPTMGMALTVVTLMIGYTKYFATNFLGISASTIGTLMAVAAVFDGVTDIVAGYLIDHINLKMGKGRPFQLSFIGIAVSMALLFSTPQMSTAASSAYVFVMYAMYSAIFRTLMECSEPVYMANAIDDPKDAVNLSSINGVMALVVGMISGIVLPQVIKNYGTTRQGWTAIGWVVGLLCAVFAMIRVALIKEKKKNSAQKQEPITFKGLFKAIFSNKYILLVALMILVSGAATGIQMDIVVYYTQYILGDLGAQSVLGLANLFVVIIMMVAPAISKKFGVTNMLKITTAITFVGALIRLISPSNLMVVFIGSLLASCGFNITVNFANVLLIDCMDYGEWKNGTRAEGALACAKSVTSKIGTAVASGLFAMLLGMSGYDGALAVQPASANNMIIAMYTIIPAIFAVLLLVILHFYDLEKHLPKIREALEAKKQGR